MTSSLVAVCLECGGLMASAPSAVERGAAPASFDTGGAIVLRLASSRDEAHYHCGTCRCPDTEYGPRERLAAVAAIVDPEWIAWCAAQDAAAAAEARANRERARAEAASARAAREA